MYIQTKLEQHPFLAGQSRRTKKQEATGPTGSPSKTVRRHPFVVVGHDRVHKVGRKSGEGASGASSASQDTFVVIVDRGVQTDSAHHSADPKNSEKVEEWFSVHRLLRNERPSPQNLRTTQKSSHDMASSPDFPTIENFRVAPPASTRREISHITPRDRNNAVIRMPYVSQNVSRDTKQRGHKNKDTPDGTHLFKGNAAHGLEVKHGHDLLHRRSWQEWIYSTERRLQLG